MSSSSSGSSSYSSSDPASSAASIPASPSPSPSPSPPPSPAPSPSPPPSPSPAPSPASDDPQPLPQPLPQQQPDSPLSVSALGAPYRQPRRGRPHTANPSTNPRKSRPNPSTNRRRKKRPAKPWDSSMSRSQPRPRPATAASTTRRKIDTSRYGYDELAKQVEKIRIPTHARKRHIPQLLVSLGSLRELALLACDRLRDAEAAAASARADAARADHALAQREIQLAAAVKQLRESSAAAAATERSLRRDLADAAARAQSSIDALEARLDAATTAKKRVESAAARKDTLLAARNDTINAANDDLARARKAAAAADAAKKRALIDAAEANRRALAAESALSAANQSAATDDLLRESRARDAESKALTALRADNDRKARYINELKIHLADAQADLDALRAKSAKRSRTKAQLHDARAEEARLHEHAAALKARLDKQAHELSATQMELGNMTAKFNRLQRSHTKLKKRVALSKATTSPKSSSSSSRPGTARATPGRARNIARPRSRATASEQPGSPSQDPVVITFHA